MLTTDSASAILAPPEVGALVVQPLIEQSVATQVATIVQTRSNAFRVPVVTDDPTAAWVEEGAEIPTSDAALTEATAEMRKLAGLSIISDELRTDSSPAAHEAIGAGLVRDLQRKLDAAFFGDLAAPAPAGLAALEGVSEAGDATGTLPNFDAFELAISLAEQESAQLSSFVAHPLDVLRLATTKKSTGSAENLMQSDPTLPGRRMISGVPVFGSTAVARGTAWGIPKDRVYIAMHDEPELAIDSSVFFTSHRSAIRALLRCGFAFPHPAAIVKIALGTEAPEDPAA